MEAGGSRVLGCPGLHSEFKVNLGYVSCPLPPKHTHTLQKGSWWRDAAGGPDVSQASHPLGRPFSLSQVPFLYLQIRTTAPTLSLAHRSCHCFATSTRLQEHLLHVHGLLNTRCSCGPLLLSSYNEEAEGQSWLGSWFPSEFKGGAKRQERKGDNLCHNTRAKCDSQ